MLFEFYKLPDHLILDIFKKVRASDLPSIRLVCRRWASLVSDCVVLRRKQQLAVTVTKTDEIINSKHEFIQTFMHSPYNICANIKFENVVVEESEIFAKLCSKIGTNIEYLGIHLGKDWNPADMGIQLYKHNWISLLKKTPNLIELNINSSIAESNHSVYSESDEVITNAFNLKKLKIVTLDSRDSYLNQYIMKILIKSANKVATLRFGLFSNKDFDTLYFLIESQRHSLKILELGGDFKKKDWLKYLSIDNLSLEVVKFNNKTKLDRDLLELLGNHKNVRELTSYVDASEDFKQYPVYLSKLEKLELTVNFNSGDGNFSMPKRLNNLKSLKMHVNFNKEILFIIPTNCPTLQILEIKNDKPVPISPVSLQSFVDNYPNLKILKLCNYICLPQYVTAIADKLLLLEKLKLRVLVPYSKIEKNHQFPKKMDNLKSLKLHIHFQEAERGSIISFEIPTFRPMLEVLEINNDNKQMRISPVSLQRFVDNFPNLRVLKLTDYYCDAQCVAAIAEKLVHLEHLELRIHVTNPETEKNAFSTISNLKKLKHLCVFDFIHICDDRFFTEHLRLPTLTYLALFSIFPANYVTDNGIFGLTENCALLEHLCCSKFQKITNVSTNLLFGGLYYLWSLVIDGLPLNI